MKGRDLFLHGALSIILLTLLISNFQIFCFADDEIVIRSYLMRGYEKETNDLNVDASSTRLMLHVSAEESEPGVDAFAADT